MKHEQEVKELLINNAIQLIAEGGFEKATTKELTYCNGNLPDFRMNEVYIYRFFGSKEQLYESAFSKLDTQLVFAFHQGVSAVGGFGEHASLRLYEFFLRAWRFVLSNETYFRCYVRYYYSVYFKGSALEGHQKRFSAMVRELAPIFRQDADTNAILHSVFTTMLDFAVRVYNGELEDNEINRPHIFNILYCMMSSYIKNPENHTSSIFSLKSV